MSEFLQRTYKRIDLYKLTYNHKMVGRVTQRKILNFN